MNLQDKLIIKELIPLPIDIQTAKNILLANNFDDFIVTFEDNEYKIKLKVSYGTIQFSSPSLNQGIYIKLNFFYESDKLFLSLKTPFRFEYLLICVGFLFTLFVMFKSQQHLEISKIITIVAIFIITFLWFRLFIQSQEKELIQKVKNVFKQKTSSFY